MDIADVQDQPDLFVGVDRGDEGRRRVELRRIGGRIRSTIAPGFFNAFTVPSVRVRYLARRAAIPQVACTNGTTDLDGRAARGRFVPKLTDDKQHPTVDPDNLEARIEFPVVR